MKDNKIKQMAVAGLFPNPVGIFEYDKTLTNREMKYILELEKIQNVGNIRSSESYILTETKTLQKIYNFAKNCANIFFREVYQADDDVSIYITQSWCNYADKNQFHHQHAHPNSFISGVFYVQADGDKDKIIFHRDLIYKQIKIHPKTYNEYNSETWWIPAKTGTLILFDSSLTHSVPPVISDKTRISLSFNTFLKGTVGSHLNLTELKTHNI